MVLNLVCTLESTGVLAHWGQSRAQRTACPPPWKTKVEGGDEETWVPQKRVGVHTRWHRALPAFPTFLWKGLRGETSWLVPGFCLHLSSLQREVSLPSLGGCPAVRSQCELYPWGSPSRKVVRGGNGCYFIETKSKHTLLPRTTILQVRSAHREPGTLKEN